MPQRDAAASSCPAVATASTTAMQAAATGPVSPTPATGTPTLAPTGTTETVRQLVKCGGTMYAVGQFTEIQRGSTTYARNNFGGGTQCGGVSGFAGICFLPYA